MPHMSNVEDSTMAKVDLKSGITMNGKKPKRI